MAKPPRKPSYKWPEGVLAIPHELIRSDAYLALSLPARCLLVELHDCWSPKDPIHFSTRRVRERLGVSQTTAVRAFQEAQDAGFIRLANESDWLNGKAREWWLTWMPVKDKEPTADWKLSGARKTRPTSHQSTGQAPKRVTRVPVKANGKYKQNADKRKFNELGGEQISVSPKSEPSEYPH